MLIDSLEEVGHASFSAEHHIVMLKAPLNHHRLSLHCIPTGGPCLQKNGGTGRKNASVFQNGPQAEMLACSPRSV